MNPDPIPRERVAIATRHGNLSRHFRDTHAFAIFIVSDNPSPAPVYRVNLSPEDDSAESHERHHHQIADLLEGCSILVCGGIGDRAAAILEGRGVRVVVTPADGSAEKIYRRFRSGTLPETHPHGCCHAAP